MPFTPENTCVLEAWKDHQAELRGWLLRQVGDPAVADDLLAEVFLRALRSGGRFCELRNVRAWLFTTARNLLIDRSRTQRETVPVVEALSAPQDEPRPIASLARCLPRALAELDPRDADILVRCDLEGQRQADYAREHGLTLSGAKARIQRARRRLKDHLVHHCQVRFDEHGAVCCFVPRPPASDEDASP